MTEDPKTSDTYKLGFAKPPVEHQFKPGVSGNPKGRPKGAGSFLRAIVKHANKKVTVVENGTGKKMSKMDVVVSAMFNKAAKGDVSAARLLTSLLQAAYDVSAGEGNLEYTDEDITVLLGAANWQAQLAALHAEKAGADE